MPIASAIASDTGKASHSGLSVNPPPAPPVPKINATVIAASAMTELDRQIHVPGDERQRQTDGDDPDERRLLQDVQENADLEEVRNGEREPRQHEDEDDPDEVVEDELDAPPVAGT